MPALIYLAKTDPNYRLPSNASPGGLWREAMRLYDPEQNAVTPIDWSQIKEAGDLVRQWPVSTLRHTVSEKSVTNLLEFFAQSDFSNSIMRNLLSGLSPQGVNAAYLNLDPKQQKGLGPVARPWLGKTGFKAWQSIRDQGVTPFPIQKPSDRNRLFEFMYRNASSTGELKEGPWCCVGSVYQLQNDFQLSNLSRIARGTTGLYRQVFIKAFGAFKNQDKAVLQLLDYVHTDQISEQRAIVDALLEIASPRALQELLKFTGKAPFHPQLKMRIFRSLDQIDTKMVQTQIRDAIKELESKGEQTGLSKAEVTEALDLLRSRLQTESVALPNTSPSAAPPLPAKQEKAGSQNTAKQKRAKPGQAKVIKRAKQAAPTPIIQANAEVFDEARIAKVIPIFSELSGEVQRSLRTGIFFYDKVQQETAGTMDLSPVIDMQYKAMEVCLREAFQAATDILIREGVLQRKLDLLGYSRPIIEKMTRFENFISSLPIIKEIPYFSKFKLRKMLRGICQFRPGKRFTLDGLKAFALFFAVFSRGRCQYGLQNLFPLSFSEDEQLYAFVHQLHSFQDFRNRAVHEGLPPEASANLEKTWKQTSDILILICNLTNAARSIKEEEISKRTREPTFLKRNA